MLMNIARLSLLVSLGLVGCLFTVSEAKDAHVLDDGPNALNIESIAEILCNPGKKYKQQISRISTVTGLNEYFKGIPASHTLAECGHRYGLALEKLSVLVSKSNENVCSEEKISLIEEYHNDYLSTIIKYKEHQKKNNLEAPILLKTFFTHYANEVSAICERFAVNVAQKAAHEVEIDTKEKVENAAVLDKNLEKFSKKLMLNNVNSYEDVFFLWTLIDNLQKNDKLARYFSDGPTKLSVLMKDAKETQKLRSGCSNLLKPAYEKITLPVLRLISLGYYPESTQFLTEIETNSFMKRLYVLTHMCELLLPIKIYENETLDQDKIVLVTPEEASKLPTPASEEAPENVQVDTSDNSLVHVDKLEPITSEDAISVAKNIKLHIKARSNFLKKLFKFFLHELKSGAKSLPSISTSEGLTFMKSDIESSLSKIQGTDLEKLYEDQENSGIRKRRSFMGFLKQTGIVLLMIPVFFYYGFKAMFVNFFLGLASIFYHIIIVPIDVITRSRKYGKHQDS